MKKMLYWGVGVVAVVAMAVLGGFIGLRGARSAGDEIGSVNTHFKLGGSDRIAVEAIEDPDVGNLLCILSRARVGGAKGALGVAEDKSDAHIACNALGPVTFRGALPRQEDIATENLDATTKTLHVTRMVDSEHNVLTYLVYSDRFTDGSPKHDISMVVVPRDNPIPVR